MGITDGSHAGGAGGWFRTFPPRSVDSSTDIRRCILLCAASHHIQTGLLCSAASVLLGHTPNASFTPPNCFTPLNCFTPPNCLRAAILPPAAKLLHAIKMSLPHRRRLPTGRTAQGPLERFSPAHALAAALGLLRNWGRPRMRCALQKEAQHNAGWTGPRRLHVWSLFFPRRGRVLKRRSSCRNSRAMQLGRPTPDDDTNDAGIRDAAYGSPRRPGEELRTSRLQC